MASLARATLLFREEQERQWREDEGERNPTSGDEEDNKKQKRSATPAPTSILSLQRAGGHPLTTEPFAFGSRGARFGATRPSTSTSAGSESVRASLHKTIKAESPKPDPSTVYRYHPTATLLHNYSDLLLGTEKFDRASANRLKVRASGRKAVGTGDRERFKATAIDPTSHGPGAYLPDRTDVRAYDFTPNSHAVLDLDSRKVSRAMTPCSPLDRQGLGIGGSTAGLGLMEPGEFGGGLSISPVDSSPLVTLGAHGPAATPIGEPLTLPGEEGEGETAAGILGATVLTSLHSLPEPATMKAHAAARRARFPEATSKATEAPARVGSPSTVPSRLHSPTKQRAIPGSRLSTRSAVDRTAQSRGRVPPSPSREYQLSLERCHYRPDSSSCRDVWNLPFAGKKRLMEGPPSASNLTAPSVAARDSFLVTRMTNKQLSMRCSKVELERSSTRPLTYLPPVSQFVPTGNSLIQAQSKVVRSPSAPV